MTSEEKQKAIDALKTSAPVIAVTQEEFNDYIQTLNKIMDWLEQQPSDDAISRQAVLDMMQMRVSGKELYKAVYDLPPVNPQPCGDLISRKAILEEFENDQYHLEFCKEHHIERSISMEMVRIRLHDLPSVNPQPCDDAISREDALMCLTGEIKETDTIETIIARFVRRIRKLPPVTPQPKMGCEGCTYEKNGK